MKSKRAQTYPKLSAGSFTLATQDATSIPVSFGLFTTTFLVLVLCGWKTMAYMESDTRGLDVVLGHDCRELFPKVPTELRPIVLQIHADGSIRINAESVPENNVIPMINAALSTRQEKVVYLLAEEDLPYSRFVALVDRLNNGVSDLYIAMNRDLGPSRFEEQACLAVPM